MANPADRTIDTNTTVRTSSNPNVAVRISSNTNMAMLSQQAQDQALVPYGYGYQYGYEYAGNPHVPHYPYAAPPQAPQEAPVVDVVRNINPYGYTLPYNDYLDNNNQGHNNYYYGHPWTYQFQPATPQPQHHYYHQQLQLQQPGTGRFEIMQGQRSQTGTGRSAEVVQDEYNLPGFITRYANAKFFVIKSSSKEHVLSSIRHAVWTSTLTGNRKLNAAYAEAASGDQQTGGTSSASGSKCPIFLLFSLNKSGNFCGVAEMVGPVDFGATTEFWQWKGKFPVKWHMVKDVPFEQIFHINLECNENRSIICSRDTQQVEKEKGEEMLDIFKNYFWTTSLLDEIACSRQRRVKVSRRPPSSPLHNHNQEQQPQHNQQQDVVVEEEDAMAISCSSGSNSNNTKDDQETDNNKQEEETDHNGAREYECRNSQDTDHNNNQQEETEQNNAQEFENRENQETESTIITGTNHSASNNNQKQEELTDHDNNSQESDCAETHNTESSVISMTRHSTSNIYKKQEEKTVDNKEQEETDQNNPEEFESTENQETESSVVSLISHDTSNNNKQPEEETQNTKQEKETDHNNARQYESGENQETDNIKPEQENTDHNNAQKSESGEKSQVTPTTVISVTSHSPSKEKQEEQTNTAYMIESECEESDEIQGTAVSVGSQTVSDNNNNKKEKKTTRSNRFRRFRSALFKFKCMTFV